ncbi:MAG TPA: RsmB/NOP family class I SAM-dependent RNA methyltransferase, partial [Candidatus Didemnitutus sp.]|nr:RsmB/NOP family class I SAM-dependent RNA methyltransferase [Candidatus Didemnitutus sp.]
PHISSESALPRRIKDLLGKNRAFGSRDRRLYRELIYTAIRFLPWIAPLLDQSPESEAAAQIVAWLAPEMKDTHAYRAALLEGWPTVPDSLAEKASVLAPRFPSGSQLVSPGSLLPEWFRSHNPAAFEPPHLDALLARAPLWIRLQTTDPAMVLDEFKRRGWTPSPFASVPDAWALPPNAEVADSDAYRRGFVEIQDLGSQLVLLHAAIKPGERWLDACAGAGGKTLQLARVVGDGGHVDASDIRLEMLDELRDRAARAKLTHIRAVRTPSEGYDGVIVDAPCSGSGTWRRLPHMKWYTQPEMIPKFAATQLEILSLNSERVRPGGLLVYATCSLSHVENHDVVGTFLKHHPKFTPEAPVRDWGAVSDGFGHTLMPGTHNTDGFYVALLRRGR